MFYDGFLVLIQFSSYDGNSRIDCNRCEECKDIIGDKFSLLKLYIMDVVYKILGDLKCDHLSVE